jgi:hypothetical protein
MVLTWRQMTRWRFIVATITDISLLISPGAKYQSKLEEFQTTMKVHSVPSLFSVRPSAHPPVISPVSSSFYCFIPFRHRYRESQMLMVAAVVTVWRNWWRYNPTIYIAQHNYLQYPHHNMFPPPPLLLVV